MKKEKQLIYVSSSNNKFNKKFVYYKNHPFKYLKYMGIKLKWYQTLLLLIPHDYRTDEQKMIDKVLKKFRTKKKNRIEYLFGHK